MNKTSIEWVKNPDGTQGYTWNPITGCLNHDNGLCKGGGFPCYACKLAHGRLRQRYLANDNIAPLSEGRKWIPMRDISDPFYPRFWEEKLKQPINELPLKPCGIFICDMSELFGGWVPNSWQESIFETIRTAKGDRFYLLTKQPQNLIKFSPFPENCWVGVTATNDLMAIDASNYLNGIKAKIKYISFEPLLQWDLDQTDTEKVITNVDGLIIGACTGSQAAMMALALRENPQSLNRVMPLDNRLYTFQPRIEWVQEIVEAAGKAGIKVFLKNNLKPLLAIQGIQDNRFWVDKRDEDGFEDLHLELRQVLP